MPVYDDLGKRMKENYETVSKYKLTRRTPVIIRIDGRSFHTYTRGFRKPFDPILMKSMQRTMQSLCEDIQGCVLGYTQSDEISLLLIDYKDLHSQAWFDNEVQKICSISASIATKAFNIVFDVLSHMFFIDDNHIGYPPRTKAMEEELGKPVDDWTTEDLELFYDRNEDFCKLCGVYDRVSKHAMFDSRCFNIPKEEVTNYFYWRQQDAVRNSIQMVGRANFSHGELYNKSCSDIQEMLHEQKGINWNDFSVPEKRGTCCIKTENGWIIDKDIPIFKGEGRDYIEKLVYVGD